MKSVACIVLFVLLAAHVSLAQPNNRVSGVSYPRGFQYHEVGLWGDLPYSDLQALEGVPRLIKHMNDARLAFTVHDGDLKAGGVIANSVTPTTCSNALYAQSLAYFNALTAPAMYVPGDNEWTDCDRVANGNFSSTERLDYIRATFFNTRNSLGKKTLPQQVQYEKTCQGVRGDVACVENRRWSFGGVMYITANLPGSCNNLCDTAPQPLESYKRTNATIRWLKEGFAKAKLQKVAAVMIITQATPGFDLSDGTRAPLRNPNTFVLSNSSGLPDLVNPDGFQDWLVVLRNETIAFGKPVAYVHGDSHYFRVDKPMLTPNGRGRVNNFVRVETPGNNADKGNSDVQWVKALVDPFTPEVFAWQPMYVPGNDGL